MKGPVAEIDELEGKRKEAGSLPDLPLARTKTNNQRTDLKGLTYRECEDESVDLSAVSEAKKETEPEI